MNNAIDIHSRNTPTIHQLRRASWKVRVIHGSTCEKYIGQEIVNY